MSFVLLVSNLRPFRQSVAAIAHTQVDQDALPTSKVNPIKTTGFSTFICILQFSLISEYF